MKNKNNQVMSLIKLKILNQMHNEINVYILITFIGFNEGLISVETTDNGN